jgi:hypothetical protein
MRAIIAQEFAIGIQDELIARSVEDDASARPIFVFVRPHQGTQGGIHSPVAAGGIMANFYFSVNLDGDRMLCIAPDGSSNFDIRAGNRKYRRIFFV